MNNITKETPRLLAAGRLRFMLLPALLVTACCATAGLIAFSAHNYLKGRAPHAAVGNGLQQAVTPDPRFVTVKPPKIPAITSPDAQRVVVAMQNSYRCMHPANWQTPLGSLSKVAIDAPVSLEDLASSVQKSLGALPDACYVTSVLPQVTNPRTPAALMNVYYEDLTRRPDPIKLRGFFLIAGIQSHPLAGRALEDLRSAMNSDYGTDWQRWDTAISDQLSREDKGMRGLSCRFH